MTANTKAVPARTNELLGSSLRCFGRKPTVRGTSGNDTIVAGPGRDVIVGLEGDDTIRGLRGEDTVCAGPGNDHVTDVSGYGVRLKLGRGDDRIEDARDFGWLFANRGDDTIVLDVQGGVELTTHMGPGDDTLRSRPKPGGRRVDFTSACVSFAYARHTITVDLGRGVADGEGSDQLSGVTCVYGSPHADSITGSAMADYIEDRDGATTVRAGGGDDYVNASTGPDLAYLGPGNDTLNGYDGADRAFGGPGQDDLTGHAGVDSLHGGPGDDGLFGADDCRADPADSLGDGSPNDLHGDLGNDLLIGDTGNDLLDGGPGTDRGFGMEDGLLDALVLLEHPQRDSCLILQIPHYLRLHD